MTALIVDDEPKARSVLRKMILECDIIPQIVAEASDIPEAVRLINQHEPDLVFLDIDMPGQDGFSLFDYFDKIPFRVIFVTASRDHAIEAFKVSALDYILKPVNPDELCRAVSKAAELKHPLEKEQLDVLNDNLNENTDLNRIALSSNESIEFVPVEEISYLKADGPYTEFHLTDNRTIIVSKALGEYGMLESVTGFMKTHRSYLINLHEVRSYRKEDGGFIEMKNGDATNLSRYKKEAFIEAMQQL